MDLGEVRLIKADAFAVAGRAGEGLVSESNSWVPPLWEACDTHLPELLTAITDEEPQLHLWGLMTDSEVWLAPWEEVGRYLAGLQVPPETEIPEGWELWQIPAAEYFVLKTNEENLPQMTEEVLSKLLPEHQLQLAGAIQEHYRPEFDDGEVELYFPVTPKA